MAVPGRHQPLPEHISLAEQELVSQLVRAYQTADVEALTALLTDDVVVSMPPVPLEYHGRELAARFNAAVAFRHGRTYDLVPTRANGQLAFGAYLRDPAGGVRHASGLRVLTLAGNRICGLTRFGNSALPRFGLPQSLPGSDPSGQLGGQRSRQHPLGGGATWSPRRAGAGHFDAGVRPCQHGDPLERPGGIVQYDARRVGELGERDKLAGAGHVNECQSGQFEVDLAWAVKQQLAECAAKSRAAVNVGLAVEEQPATACEPPDSERACGHG